MHACMHACMYVCMYVCMHVCMYACILILCIQHILYSWNCASARTLKNPRVILEYLEKITHLRLDVFQQLSLPSDILETEETNQPNQTNHPNNQPNKQTKQNKTKQNKTNKQNAVVFGHWILVFCFCSRSDVVV